MKVEIPANKSGKDLFTWLTENKSTLISQKKFELKRADAIGFSTSLINDKGEVVKADPDATSAAITKIQARLVINTTKLFDSHGDVHIDNLWSKSLSETNLLYLLQEHELTFAGIISDEVKASAETLSWKSLGLAAPGNTQALVFNVTIDKERNPYMFEQYRKGYVKNHSVGMRYVKLFLCINDEDYKEEFANWNKYYDQIVNKEDVDSFGYFWAVTEARVIEGSAVPKGSNFITPTLSVQDKTEPVSATLENEPLNSTHELNNKMYYQNLF